MTQEKHPATEVTGRTMMMLPDTQAEPSTPVEVAQDHNIKVLPLRLREIMAGTDTQIRAKIDLDTVAEYAGLMAEGVKFPPLTVFYDGQKFVLADGFHRFMAASRNGLIIIKCEVHQGNRSDALRFALGANSAHGLRRTNADKRRSVELALKEWPTLSDRQLATVCAVGNKFVGDVRQQLCSEHSSQPQIRLGADGKKRKLPTRKPKAAPKADQEPTPEPERPEPTAPAPEDDSFARHYFAAQVEELLQFCLDKGSPEQQAACQTVCAEWSRKFRTATGK